MSVRTAVLFSGPSGGPGLQYLYTSPPGFTTILKDIRLVQLANGSLSTAFGVASGPTLIYLMSVVTQANGEVRDDQGFIVLAPGDRLWVSTSVLNGVGLHLSGSRLDGVAP